MRTIISSIAFAALPSFAMAGAADGVWKTNTGKDGGVLEVTISACGANTCGKITKAYNPAGSEDTGYVNLGKTIISDMSADGDSSYSGGKIWDPENGKTYSSKMSVDGNTLEVDGCIGPFCSDQKWIRIK